VLQAQVKRLVVQLTRLVEQNEVPHLVSRNVAGQQQP
jgi:hypothetical protein